MGNITHTFNCAIADDAAAAAAGEVLPSHWNAGHVISLTTADVPDSTNKRYITDAQQVVVGNTSGTNTGDQTDATLSTSDITTNNVSTTKHGFAPKAPNDATKFLDGTGAYSVPAGGSPAGSGTELQYRNAGAFGAMGGTAWDNTNRALTITGATVTTSNPIFSWTQTWNAGAVVFSADVGNVTSTASHADSVLLDRQVAGVSKFSVNKAGYFASGPITSGGFQFVLQTDANYLYMGPYNNGPQRLRFGSGWISGNSGTLFSWSNSSSDGTTADTALGRNAARVVEINNGTAGTFGDLKLRTLTASGGVIVLANYTVATLPSASTSGAGATAFVTDASTTLILGLGGTVAGGGSNKVPVYSDATNWIYG